MHATLLFSNGLSENRGGPRVQRQTALDSPAAASWLPLTDGSALHKFFGVRIIAAP